MKTASAAFLFFVSTFSYAITPDYNKAADFLCKSPLSGNFFAYADFFSRSFIEDVPESYFLQVTQSLIETTGKCETYAQVRASEISARYQFISSRGDYSILDFNLDKGGLISGLSVSGVSLPSVVIRNLDDINNYAKTLGGEISVTLQSELRNSHQRLGNTLHPLGSGFKLYVLGAAADAVKNGTLKWTDSFALKQEWKSLPSGVMQTWPDGKLVSLQQYAEYMIKISDNTATDHLIQILGRENVENQLSVMGNDFIAKNQPLLTTAEMFKIKWAAPLNLVQLFLSGNETQKREILTQLIDRIPLSQVGINGVSMETPTHITDIEWFGSTNNLCSAMSTLKNKSSGEALDILSKNVPFVDMNAASVWEYVGYKGGSEPGVRTMTYLLKSKSQHWGCVSVAWHNSEKEINEWILFDLVQKTLKLAESYF